MGKSPNSCFKIISCGADSTDVDDDQSHSENKQSSDKRRWSFHKRSARHQVPSNTVISEPQFAGFNKENPEATIDRFYSVKNSSVPEKNKALEHENVTAPLSLAVANSEETILSEQTNETASLSSVVINSEIPPVVGLATETAPSSLAVVNSEVEAVSDTRDVTTSVDANLQENVIIIQAAARRFLARREVQKVKKVIKLQSSVRGHLVRRQAIGTLRCVQAIVKMQALVRARHARQCQLLEESSGQEKNEEKFKIDSWNPDLKSNQTNHTVEKLLSNSFARQLLENSPSKAKPIYISGDPLRHDSAWQWLERWMAVTSSKVEQEQELNWVQGYHGDKENNSCACEGLDVILFAEASMLSGSNLSPGKVADAEGERDSDTDNFGKFGSRASSIFSDQWISLSAEGNKEQYLGEGDIEIKEEKVSQTVRGKEAFGMGLQSDHDNYLNNSDSVTGNLRYNHKIVSSELMENEGKKFDFGSRKIRNPTFAAVQAKFEELSSAPKPSSSVSVVPKPNHSQVVSMAKNNDLSYALNSNIQNSTIQVATSECDTEISFSSTLDSPDRSEPDGGEIVIEIGTSRVANYNMNNGVSEAFSLESVKSEAKVVSTTADEFTGETFREDDENITNSTDGGEIVIEIGTSRVVNHNMNNGVSEACSLESMKSEAKVVSTAADEFNGETFREDNANITNSTAAVDSEMVENQQENLKPQAYEGSPLNNVVATESHGTPSSQVSVQSTKTIKTPNNIIARKIKSKSGSKISPSNVKHDSEHLPKDIKNANKRTSSGIAKLDNEPRHGSSSSALPSYMQATESARAKAHGSVSLKPSPDAHEKDDNSKKRHSLPIGNDKQGSSPRVQRSTSQTQQCSKHNNNHSPHGSAERRWQR